MFAEPARGTGEGEVAAPEPCGTWHRANPVSPLKPRGFRADPGCCWGSAATPALRRVPVCAPQTGTVLGKLSGARQGSALVAESRVGAPLLHQKISFFCRRLLLLLPFALRRSPPRDDAGLASTPCPPSRRASGQSEPAAAGGELTPCPAPAPGDGTVLAATGSRGSWVPSCRAPLCPTAPCSPRTGPAVPVAPPAPRHTRCSPPPVQPLSPQCPHPARYHEEGAGHSPGAVGVPCFLAVLAKGKAPPRRAAQSDPPPRPPPTPPFATPCVEMQVPLMCMN